MNHNNNNGAFKLRVQQRRLETEVGLKNPLYRVRGTWRFADYAGRRAEGLTSSMRVEAYLAAWKKGVSQVYLKLPLFFS